MSNSQITMNAGDVTKSLRIIGEEMEKIQSGLKHMKSELTDAAEESNLTFLSKLAEQYSNISSNFQGVINLVSDLHDSYKRYEKEYSEYEQS